MITLIFVLLFLACISYLLYIKNKRIAICDNIYTHLSKANNKWHVLIEDLKLMQSRSQVDNFSLEITEKFLKDFDDILYDYKEKYPKHNMFVMIDIFKTYMEMLAKLKNDIYQLKNNFIEKNDITLN